MSRSPILATVLMAALLVTSPAPAAVPTLEQSTRGSFHRVYWYQPGLEHGNPRFDGRFRVNAPEVVLDPRFMYRSEVRENGLMMILIEEDLARLESASLYFELWGGHPGSGEKRVTVNGRSTYVLPDRGAAHSCTHSYPTVNLEITDLVNGYNALQFAVDQGETFWGHFIVDNASLTLGLPEDHPDLVEAGLADFHAQLSATPGPDETILVRLEGDDLSAVDRVDFIGHYVGYDENGSTRERDWHLFTKEREIQAHLGTATTEPFALAWDTSMLPAQGTMAVMARVSFREHPDLRYSAAPIAGFSTPPGRPGLVSIHHCRDLPKPFWSRAGREQSCHIDLDVDPADVERAELHVVLWDGGAGTVEEYFTLNGRPLDVAGGGHHDVLYRVVPLEPDMLQKGPNRIELLSDTEHHGIEVLLPGPALVVRSRKTDDGGER